MRDIYIYMCVCVCVCVYKMRGWKAKRLKSMYMLGPIQELEVAWGQENTSIRLCISKRMNEIQLESPRGWSEEEHLLS